MKRKGLTLLLSIFVAANLAACSKTEEDAVGVSSAQADANVTEPGTLPVVKEKITLNLGVKDWRYVQDYETNAYTKWLEEQTNIDLNFTLFPVAETMEKLRLQIASNSELPDVLINMGIPLSELSKYGSDGLVVDLKGYFDESAYWSKDIFDKSLDPQYVRKSMTSYNGSMYFMPCYVEQTGNDYGRKAFINKAWLDKLGLQIPETTQDLENVLAAFRDNDPNGNGKKDEIGITGSKNGWNETVIPFLMNSFISDDVYYRMTVQNGTVAAAFNTEQWREGLRYMNRLAQNGLFDVQSFTQDGETLKTIAQNPDANIIGAVVTGSPDGLFSTNFERMNEYVALPPLKGPEGVAYAIKTNSPVNDGGIITKYCKNKLAAFRLLDFMMSEESALRSRYGVPQQDWFPAEAGDVCMFESIGAEPKIRAVLPFQSVQNSHWYAMNPQFRSFDIANGIVWDGNELDGEYFKAKALEAYVGKEPEERIVTLIFNEEEQEEYSSLETDIKEYVKESSAMFIIGQKDLDKDWDAYLDTLKSMKLDRFVELAQIGYDRYNNN